MKATSSGLCRGGEVAHLALSRIRAPAELCGVLQRIARGQSALGATSAPQIAYATSARRHVCICSAVDGVGETSQKSTIPTVKIRIPYRVNYGEVLRVVGSSSLLGNWSADRGLQLTWTEGDVWTADVPVTAGHYEFKCVVYNTTTNAVERWEDGGNRILNIPAEPGSWEVACQWGATVDMTQAFTPAPAPPAPPPAAAKPEPVPAEVNVAATSGDAAAEASGAEQLTTFQALDAAAEASQLQAVGLGASSDGPSAASLSESGEASTVGATAAADGFAGGAAAATALLLATCAAGVVAAVALLGPGVGGGLEESSVGGRAAGEALRSSLIVQSSLAGAQVRAVVESQLAALAGQVSAMQPAMQAQMASVQGSVGEGIAELQPMMRSGVSYVQGQANELQGRATAATGDAGAGTTAELRSRLVTRQG